MEHLNSLSALGWGISRMKLGNPQFMCKQAFATNFCFHELPPSAACSGKPAFWSIFLAATSTLSISSHPSIKAMQNSAPRRNLELPISLVCVFLWHHLRGSVPGFDTRRMSRLQVGGGCPPHVDCRKSGAPPPSCKVCLLN